MYLCGLLFGETWLKWLQIAFCFPFILVQPRVVYSLTYNKCQWTRGWFPDSECGFSDTNCQVGVAQSDFWDRVLWSFDHVFFSLNVFGMSLEAVIARWGFLSVFLTAILSSFSSFSAPPTLSSLCPFLDLWLVLNLDYLLVPIYRLYWFEVLFDKGGSHFVFKCFLRTESNLCAKFLTLFKLHKWDFCISFSQKNSHYIHHWSLTAEHSAVLSLLTATGTFKPFVSRSYSRSLAFIHPNVPSFSLLNFHRPMVCFPFLHDSSTISVPYIFYPQILFSMIC